jgi:hypothetical protein
MERQEDPRANAALAAATCKIAWRDMSHTPLAKRGIKKLNEATNIDIVDCFYCIIILLL